jgi:hypothetical protein
VEDWRYENLRNDVGQLRKEIREIEGRAYKLETWRMLLPLRMMILVCWLFNAGMVVFIVARAATH